MDSVGSNQKVTFFFTTTTRQNHSVDSFFITTDEIWGRHHRCSSLINKIKVQGHPKECFRPRNSQLRKGFFIPSYFPFSPVATPSGFIWVGPWQGGKLEGKELDPTPRLQRPSGFGTPWLWPVFKCQFLFSLELTWVPQDPSHWRPPSPEEQFLPLLASSSPHLGLSFGVSSLFRQTHLPPGKHSSSLPQALGLTHGKPTPLSTEPQFSPKAAGYFLALEVNLESCSSLSNSHIAGNVCQRP